MEKKRLVIILVCLFTIFSLDISAFFGRTLEDIRINGELVPKDSIVTILGIYTIDTCVNSDDNIKLFLPSKYDLIYSNVEPSYSKVETRSFLFFFTQKIGTTYTFSNTTCIKIGFRESAPSYEENFRIFV